MSPTPQRFVFRGLCESPQKSQSVGRAFSRSCSTEGPSVLVEVFIFSVIGHAQTAWKENPEVDVPDSASWEDSCALPTLATLIAPA